MEIAGNETETASEEATTEEKSESALWLFPQVSYSLFTDEEKGSYRVWHYWLPNR